MPQSYSRAAVLGVLCALAGCFLVIAALGERLRFDRLAVELALFAPLAIWFAGGRLRIFDRRDHGQR